MALTTLATVKTYVGITDSSEDTKLTLMIAEVDTLIKSYLHQNIEAATYTEYYSGNGTQFLRLRQRPVTAVTSVYLDPYGYYGTATNAFSSDTLLEAGVDYALIPDQADGSSRCGLLQRLQTVWPQASEKVRGMLTPSLIDSKGAVKVSYAAGYATVPKDLELAANITVANLRALRFGVYVVTGEHYEDYGFNLQPMVNAQDILAPAKSILARYRPLEL